MITEYSTARMTPAAARMAEAIPTEDRTGLLELWCVSLSDDGRGCFSFGDEAMSYRVWSDGEVESNPICFV